MYVCKTTTFTKSVMDSLCPKIYPCRGSR